MKEKELAAVFLDTRCLGLEGAMPPQTPPSRLRWAQSSLFKRIFEGGTPQTPPFCTNIDMI